MATQATQAWDDAAAAYGTTGYGATGVGSVGLQQPRDAAAPRSREERDFLLPVTTGGDDDDASVGRVAMRRRMSPSFAELAGGVGLEFGGVGVGPSPHESCWHPDNALTMHTTVVFEGERRLAPHT